MDKKQATKITEDKFLELYEFVKARHRSFLESETPPPILLFDGDCVNVEEGTLTFTGGEKTGKSSTMLHLTLLRICKGFELKTGINLGLENKTHFTELYGDAEGYFLYIDPENSSKKAKINYQNNIINSLHFLIEDEDIRKELIEYVKEKLIFIGLRETLHRRRMHELAKDNILEYISIIIGVFETKGNKITGIAIDNVLKLNPENNQKNAEDIFNKLDEIKADYGITAYLSIHTNKNNEKATGHFGTSVGRYSETHFHIKKEKDTHKISITTTAFQNQGLAKRFKFLEEYKCFDYSDNYSGTYDTYSKQMQKILSNGKYLSVNDLAIKLKEDGANLTTRALTNHIKENIESGLLEIKDKHGTTQFVGLSDEAF